MENSVIKYLFESGNVYWVVIVLLAFVLYKLISYFYEKYKADKSMRNGFAQISAESKKEHKENLDCLDDLKKQIDDISKKLEDLKNQMMLNMKEFEHSQEKEIEKILEQQNTINEMKKDIMELKHKLEILIMQMDISAKINKGL